MEKEQFKKWKWKMTGCALIIFLLAACIRTNKVWASDYTSAQTLPLNGSWSSEYWLTDTDQEQWYKIVIPSDGKLTYKMMGYGRINCELYDEVCSRRFDDWHTGGTNSSPDTGVSEKILSGGIYYFKITPYYGSLGKYKLNASFLSYNANDAGAVSYVSPQRISLGSVITGALTPTDEEDWYQISIPKNGYYHYKITAFTHISYVLYNEDLSRKIKGCGTLWFYNAFESSPGTDENDMVLSAGVYYLKVNSGRHGKYTFKISALSQSDCSHDYQDTYFEPTYTRKGYTLHKCSKCGHSYQDDFKSKLVLEKPNIYTLYAGKKKAVLSWSSVSNASGYEISYKVKKSEKKLKVKGASKTRRTIKKLKARKKYTVRVRAYKKVGKATVYSKWSSKKSVKVR